MLAESQTTHYVADEPKQKNKSAQDDIHKLKSYWAHFDKKAHKHYSNGSFQQAATLFNQCISISERILKETDLPNNTTLSAQDKYSNIERLYFASHNLAACQNCMHKGSAAEKTLLNTYKTIVSICKESDSSYDNKLDALATLDKCVFSVCSQFAYLGKVSHIHELIIEAENFGGDMLNSLGLKA